MGDESKKLLALLNGIARRTYYGEEDMTDDFLLSQIYPDSPKEESSGLITKCSVLLKVCHDTPPFPNLFTYISMFEFGFYSLIPCYWKVL